MSFVYTLLNDSSITDLLSSSGLNPLAMSQDASFPLVIYRVSESKRNYSLDGCSVKRSMLEISILGTDYSECQTIAQAIEDRCGGYTGTIGGEKIHFCFLVDSEDLYQEPVDVGSEAPILYRLRQEYELLHVTA